VLNSNGETIASQDISISKSAVTSGQKFSTVQITASEKLSASNTQQLPTSTAKSGSEIFDPNIITGPTDSVTADKLNFGSTGTISLFTSQEKGSFPTSKSSTSVAITSTSTISSSKTSTTTTAITTTTKSPCLPFECKTNVASYLFPC